MSKKTQYELLQDNLMTYKTNMLNAIDFYDHQLGNFNNWEKLQKNIEQFSTYMSDESIKFYSRSLNLTYYGKPNSFFNPTFILEFGSFSIEVFKGLFFDKTKLFSLEKDYLQLEPTFKNYNVLPKEQLLVLNNILEAVNDKISNYKKDNKHIESPSITA